MSLTESLTKLARFSLVVCRNQQHQYLCIQERTYKWWICGGGVEKNQTHWQAALRQAKEEAGIDVQLKGILAIDQVHFTIPAVRVIYYAQPKDQLQKPKEFTDKESRGARFMSLNEIISISNLWRSREIFHYPRYLEQGGQVFPLWCFRDQLLIDVADERKCYK